jgi:hypothetical protein
MLSGGVGSGVGNCRESGVSLCSSLTVIRTGMSRLKIGGAGSEAVKIRTC